MKYLIFTLVISLIFTTGGALIYPNNYEEQQQLLQQELLRQQQLNFLQQQQGQGQDQLNKQTNIKTILPQPLLNDFVYIPTAQGYRFSYKLPDATTREENAFISNQPMDAYSVLDSKNTDFTAVDTTVRPKMNLKNRKLSPGALKGLVG